MDLFIIDQMYYRDMGRAGRVKLLWQIKRGVDE